MFWRNFLLLLVVFGLSVSAKVNENSGTMSFIENLFKVESNTISLDVGLTYSSGISVNQRASWVGLGFSLTIPFIKRIPQGSVDEKSGNFYCYGEGFYSDKDFRKLITNSGNGYDNTPATGDFTNQQDVYILNANFASGRIVFEQPSAAQPDAPLKAYLQNWQPLKIEYHIDEGDAEDDVDDDIDWWKITDENGIIYIFGQPVRASTDPASYTLNTGRTFNGTNGSWDEVDYKQIITEDHYVNETFNCRWYLTEIRSANYSSTTGEKITISYTTPGETGVFLADLFYNIDDEEDEILKAVTNIFKYEDGDDTHAAFTCSYDNYSIYPVYPEEIESSSYKAKFFRGDADDRLMEGDKYIDRIELYTKDGDNFNLASQLKFNYDETGLCAGHPYSSDEKGRLQLNGISVLSSDGSINSHIYKFEYASNPAWGGGDIGYFQHDLYGFYSNAALVRNSGDFNYPQGQSTVGTVASPGAEAWSVKRVLYGNGRIVEYEYEPNIVTKLSTTESFITDDAPYLNPGIRVSEMKVYDGVTNVPTVTTFDYENGYISHTYAVLPDIEDMYELLNVNRYSDIKNIMFLQSLIVNYEACTRSVTNSGAVKIHFLSPGMDVEIYESDPVANLNLCDVYIGASGACGTKGTGKGINSLTHYRGLPWKTEYYRQGSISSNPVKTITINYAIEYSKHSYTTPEVEARDLHDCPVGNPSQTPAPEMAENQNQTVFIGFIREIERINNESKVKSRSKVLKYNNTNALPEIVQSINSEGKQLLKKTSFAFENSNYSAGMGLNGAHMLVQQSQSITYEKPNGSTSQEPVSSDVRAASATTYSNNLGNSAWMPYKMYSWKADLQEDGPDKTFANFVHTSGTSNPNWQFIRSIEKYSVNNRVIETTKPLATGQPLHSTTIYGYNNTLPVASVTNAEFQECGVFTGDYKTGTSPYYWDNFNGWEMGSTNTVELVGGSNAHFGEKAIHVIQDYAAGRNNRIYPGKSYVMTAWVKVTDGEIKMATDFRYANTGHENEWPAVNITTVATPAAIWADPITKDDCNSGTTWKLMKMEIPSNVTAQLDPSDKVWYARAWVGNDPEAASFEAYVDDIRFGPSNALTTSTFYDQKWLKPIIIIDANNKPGRRVAYDDFSRPIKWDKIDPTKSYSEAGYDITVQKKEYHMRNELPEGEVVQVLSPNGGEDYDGAGHLMIRWVNAGTQGINLFYKEKNSDDTWPTSWEEITTSPLSGQTGWCSYKWTVPTSIANECLVKIEVDGSGESDESDRPFIVN